jgi:hypothetical protein
MTLHTTNNCDVTNFVAEKDYGVETKVIQMDFSEGGISYEKITSQLEINLEIGILGKR